MIIADPAAHSTASSPDELSDLIRESKELEDILVPAIEAGNALAPGLKKINEILRKTSSRKRRRVKGTDISDDHLIRERLRGLADTFQGIERARVLYGQYAARIASINLRNRGMDAYPALLSNLASQSAAETKKEQVIQIVIESMPVPDDTVPWELILEYRQDPDSKRKLSDLRRWMGNVARGELTQAEAREEIRGLMADYEAHLKSHKVVTTVITIGVILQVGVGLLEQAGVPIVSGLVSYLTGRVNLLKGESSAPGREIAYIVNTQKKFS